MVCTPKLGLGGGGGGSLGHTRCDLAEKVLNYKVLNYKDTGKGDNQRGAKGQEVQSSAGVSRLSRG